MNPVAEKKAALSAKRKAQTKKLKDQSIVHSFSSLLHSLTNLTKKTCQFKKLIPKDRCSFQVYKIENKQVQKIFDLLNVNIAQQNFCKKKIGLKKPKVC